MPIVAVHDTFRGADQEEVGDLVDFAASFLRVLEPHIITKFNDRFFRQGHGAGLGGETVLSFWRRGDTALKRLMEYED